MQNHRYALPLLKIGRDQSDWADFCPATGRDCLSIGFTWKKHQEQVLALLPGDWATQVQQR